MAGEESESVGRVLVLYATETGNAQDVAERIEREAQRRHCAAIALSLHQFDPEFWRFLLQRNLSKEWLKGVNYAVFGLGDSAYQKYNIVAKKLDKRLLDLGALPILEKGLGDDQHHLGYEAALDPWLSSLWVLLRQVLPACFGKAEEKVDPDCNISDPTKVQVAYHYAHGVENQLSHKSDMNFIGSQIGAARSMIPGKFGADDNVPHCFLEMSTNRRLARDGSDRDVRHFEFNILSSAITYNAGDVVEILPSQNQLAVDAFLQRCNLDPDAYISVQLTNAEKRKRGIVRNMSNKPIKLRAFVNLTMDVASASPKRYFFEVMSSFATVDHEKKKLEFFASPEGRDDLYRYNNKERRTVLEVLEDFPSVQMPFEWLVQLVPPLKTRLFSITSSPIVHPNEVHLTVAVVSWMTPYKRARHGLCSNWLAELNPSNGNIVPAWFHQGSLPPPPPSLPLILVGPGTGCAPFRAFVEERSSQSSAGLTAPILFFFGCRNKDNDFLYEEFWMSHARANGVLSTKNGGGIVVAFSRDQPQKVYVQHKMQEESRKIWNLLNEGAAVYIAGSASKMPADVTSCLEEIISREGSLSREDASQWLRQLEKLGRFKIEAWS